MEVDFPRSKPQTPEVKAQNHVLQQKFAVRVFPTFILIDKDGKTLWKQVGYLQGGPKTFIAVLNTYYTPAPSSSAGSRGDGSFDSFFKKPAQSPTP